MSPDDLEKLKPEADLNDNLIGAYLSYMKMEIIPK